MGTILHSPVAFALFQVLKRQTETENLNLHILDYCDDATFRALWLGAVASQSITVDRPAAHSSDDASVELDVSERSAEARPTRIDLSRPETILLIVGNEPPHTLSSNRPPSIQGVNFTDHFTATSWLAAWKVNSFALETGTTAKRKSQARIAVIDPRSPDLTGSPARELQALLGAKGANGRSLVPRATVFNEPSLSAITSWIQATASDATETSPVAADLLRTIIWNALTSDRERNHAISNVLGALLLAAQVGPEWWVDRTKHLLQELLIALVRSCGIRIKDMRTAVEPDDRRQCPVWVTERLHHSIPAVVLIDDMADLWKPFLAVALAFYDSNAGRFVTTTKDDFLEEIRELPIRLANIQGSEQKQLLDTDLLPGNRAVKNDFILFLDLRLFSKSDKKAADSFLNGVHKLGNALLLNSKRQLPWLTPDGKDELATELEGQVPPPHPPETLLPRLISLLDPTLPIVIFSSTHHTGLIDPFREYGNIITSFRKPILTGLNRDWPETVNELRSDFVNALDKATRVLAVRALIRAVSPEVHNP